MWIYVGVCLAFVWFLFARKKSCDDTLPKTDTEEFLWKINAATEKMKHSVQTLASTTLTFASEDWSAVLEIEDGSLLLTLNPQNFSSRLPENVFLGVGIVQGPGEALYYWYEVKMCKSDSPHKWHGPCTGYLLDNRDSLMPDDLLTVFLRMSTFRTPLSTLFKNCKDNDPAGRENRCCHNYKVLHNLSKNLRDLYVEDKEHDVTIKVRNETLRAHRTILRARCPALATLISETGGLLEENSHPKDFGDFLLFLYSGTGDHLATKNVTSVFDIAHKYEAFDLTEACAKYMLSELTIRSVSGAITAALKHDDFKLLAGATEFFLRHAEEIFPTVEWQKFLRKNPTRANELVIKSYTYNKSKYVQAGRRNLKNSRK